MIRADVADVGLMTDAAHGADAILHLAAKAFEDDFLSVLLPRNVTGTWSVFEAAMRAEAPKVIFASTGQVLLGNRPGDFVRPDVPPRPISIYAATKLFGEALGRYHADHSSLMVACLRLGWVVTADSPLFDTEPTLPDLWCSPDDLARLILAALPSAEPYAVVHAFSPPADARFDVSNPYGWAPADRPSRP